MTYSHLLKEWRGFFGSLAKALEVLAVWEGIKPVARILVFQDDVKKTITFLQRLPLAGARADFKVDVWGSSTGYSSKGKTMALDEGQGFLILYVARRVEDAQAAKEAEARLDHRGLGQLLGYPACCTRFFQEYEREEQQKHNTFIAPMLAHSKKHPATGTYPFQNNVLLRPIDICLLSHVPCSLDCERSKQIGERMLALLHKYSTKTEQLFRERLASTLIVEPSGEIIVLEGAVPKSPTTLGFTRAFTDRKDPFVDALNAAREIKLLPHSGVRVGVRLNQDVFLVRFS